MEKDYPEITEFKQKYNAKHGEDPMILANNAYEATKILVKALASCKGDTKCARDKAYQIKDFPGASGIISIDPDGGAQKSFVLKTVKNGKFVRVK